MPVFEEGQTELRCTKCGKIKPKKEFFIKEYKDNGDVMRRPWCRTCFNAQRIKGKRKWKRSMTDKEVIVVDCVSMRRCTKCKHLKPISAFNRDRVVNGKQLYLYLCKECYAVHRKKFYKKKPKKERIIKPKTYPMLLNFANRISIGLEKLLNLIKQSEIRLGKVKEAEDNRIELFLKREKVSLEEKRKKKETKYKKKQRLQAKKERDERRIRREQRKLLETKKNGY